MWSKINNKKISQTNILFFLSLVVLFGANILFNAWINEGPRVFYDDDLSYISGRARDWTARIFGTGAFKFRPVSSAVMFLIVKISGGNFEIIDHILLMLNYANAILVFVFIYLVIKCENKIERIGMSLMGGVLFIASHFAYYNISEVLGIMEALGVCLAMGIQIFLILYIDKGRNLFFGIATALYAAILYTHERYFVLVILFALAIIIRNGENRKNKCKLVITPIILCVSFWVLRIILFGNRALDGTGGTDIKDTFKLTTVIKYCFSQVGYILGFHCGPQYLNGIEAEHVAYGIQTLLWLRLLGILTVVVLFTRLLILDKQFRKEYFGKIVMFLTFMALCIGSSSITIRVEMRWIYVTYAMFVIMLCYMIHALFKVYGSSNYRLVLVFLFFASTIVVENYYREHYTNLYYWPTKDLSRELYNVTVKEYGDELENKDIIIVSQNPYWGNWQENEWKRFFEPYVNSNNMQICYVDNIWQAQRNRKENSIILVEDVVKRDYLDITGVLIDEAVEIMHIEKLYGIYEDWWCEPDCKFEIRGNVGGKVELTFYYPEEREKRGDASGTIIVNGESSIEFEMPDNSVTVEIELPDQEVNTVQVISNYWVYENTERSEDGRLSSVLTIKYKEDSSILVEDIGEEDVADNNADLSSEGSETLHIDKMYGIYEDWWCEPDCKFSISGNVGNRVKLNLYYPENIEKIGNASGTVIVNGESQTEFEMPDNSVTVEIELSDQKVNTVQIVLNYWVYENTGRSEDGRLSSVLTIRE